MYVCKQICLYKKKKVYIGFIITQFQASTWGRGMCSLGIRLTPVVGISDVDGLIGYDFIPNREMVPTYLLDGEEAEDSNGH